MWMLNLMSFLGPLSTSKGSFAINFLFWKENKTLRRSFKLNSHSMRVKNFCPSAIMDSPKISLELDRLNLTRKKFENLPEGVIPHDKPVEAN